MTRELRFSVTRSVRASNDAVWAVLGDFGSEHRWSRGLAHCERDTRDVRVGTARVCTLREPLMGRSQVREALTEFTPGAALAYTLDGAAGPFASAGSRWSTRSGDDGATLVTVEGRFTPRNVLVPFAIWPLAKPYLRRMTARVLAELEAFLAGPSQLAAR